MAGDERDRDEEDDVKGEKNKKVEGTEDGITKASSDSKPLNNAGKKRGRDDDDDGKYERSNKINEGESDTAVKLVTGPNAIATCGRKCGCGNEDDQSGGQNQKIKERDSEDGNSAKQERDKKPSGVTPPTVSKAGKPLKWINHGGTTGRVKNPEKKIEKKPAKGCASVANHAQRY